MFDVIAREPSNTGLPPRTECGSRTVSLSVACAQRLCILNISLDRPPCAFMPSPVHRLQGVAKSDMPRPRAAALMLIASWIGPSSRLTIRVSNRARCVGKHCVPAASWSQSAQGAVRREDFKPLRVVKLSDRISIAAIEHESNRLTLMLDDDNTIRAVLGADGQRGGPRDSGA